VGEALFPPQSGGPSLGDLADRGDFQKNARLCSNLTHGEFFASAGLYRHQDKSLVDIRDFLRRRSSAVVGHRRDGAGKTECFFCRRSTTSSTALDTRPGKSGVSLAYPMNAWVNDSSGPP